MACIVMAYTVMAYTVTAQVIVGVDKLWSHSLGQLQGKNNNELANMCKGD